MGLPVARGVNPLTILALEQRSGHDARVAAIGVEEQPGAIGAVSTMIDGTTREL